jgi:hypothetical protein
MGLLLGVPVHFVGDFFAGELLLGVIALLGILTNLDNRNFPDRRFLAFTFLFLLSLCAYIATDLLQNIAPADALRGWARFVFLFMDFVGFYVIGRKSVANLCQIFIGMMVSQCLFYAFGASAEITRLHLRAGFATWAYVWKYRLAMPVMVGVIAAITMYARRSGVVFASLIALVLAGLASFALDDRYAGVNSLAAALWVAARGMTLRRIQKLLPVLLTVAMLSGVFSIDLLLTRTRTQYGRRQAISNIYREASFMTAVETIAAHPLTGIGSWQIDFDAANRHRAWAVALGAKYDEEAYINQYGHSSLLQPWVEAGPLGALAFFYLFWRIVISLAWLLMKRPFDRYSVFILLLLLNGVAITFSPFNGGLVRLNVATAVYICIFLAREKASGPWQQAAAR